jgi:2-polyprenyl-3-methyl-5-hydroxy-6-metoxy-1,4-benzoquinol methylase
MPNESPGDIGTRLIARLAPYPDLSTLVAAQLREWPAHARVLDKSLAASDPAFLSRTNALARLVWKLAGDDIDRHCIDYHWMCDNFVEEYLFFRRHRRYRLQTFAEAITEVYGNADYMNRYVKGILLSQVFWNNHAHAIDLFRTGFLPANKADYEHLDIGPGHGLFLAYAASDPRCKAAAGWDVSASSLAATRAALARMEITRPVSLVLQDVLEAPPEADRFDSIVISEVLEHVEQPGIALQMLMRALRSGGRIFINIPVNSPAPDHIYLWRQPVEVIDLIRSAGFQIDEEYHFPTTGKSLEEAIKYKLDISCVVIAHK